ncbi:hypothetical protein BpHYR1_025463, partial [Brachionus plicatilis]
VFTYGPYKPMVLNEIMGHVTIVEKRLKISFKNCKLSHKLKYLDNNPFFILIKLYKILNAWVVRQYLKVWTAKSAVRFGRTGRLDVSVGWDGRVGAANRLERPRRVLLKSKNELDNQICLLSLNFMFLIDGLIVLIGLS